MSRFDTSDGGPVFSPDRAFFSVVTSRGRLETDSIESTLWIFRTRGVVPYLESSEEKEPPRGRPIVRLARVPKNNYTVFYAPVISDVRWQPDSKSLLFLAQDKEGERHLCRVDIRSSIVHELTPEGYDVSRYDVQGRTTVYFAAPNHQRLQIGTVINRDAVDITGMPLSALMPEIDETAYYREIWVIKRNGRWRLTSGRMQPIHLANHFPDVLSISPDERSIAVLVPTEIVPASWESYEPENEYPRLRSHDPSLTNQLNFIRPMQYAVFDVRNGKSEITLNAPNAYALGYIQQDSAIWSDDGKQILLTNTFFPLDQSNRSEKERHLKPCACAVLDLPARSTSCVAWSRYTPANRSSLLSAAFADKNHTVLLSFSTPPNGSVQERYEHNGSVWQRVERDQSDLGAKQRQKIGSSAIAGGEVSVEIREAPNDPPALYAKEADSGRSRKLWDPNPQLSSFALGEIVAFNWQDKSGYQWAGQLMRPPAYTPGKRHPLVIQTYGFSNGFVSDGFFPTASAVRALAAAGIIVLQMPRRTDHYGTAQEAPDQLLGFESAIERLDQDGLIDPNKVGIIGFSHTCFHVESALVSDPKRFRAATIADGFDGSYLQYLYSAGDPAAHLLEHIYGAQPFGPGLRAWVDRAPGFNLDKLETPLRIEAISLASVLTEWETYAALVSQGKPVDLVYFPFGDHLLQKPLERTASQQGNVDWFRFWLKDEEDPDPAKHDQYALWRQMRQQLDGRGGGSPRTVEFSNRH